MCHQSKRIPIIGIVPGLHSGSHNFESSMICKFLHISHLLGELSPEKRWVGSQGISRLKPSLIESVTANTAVFCNADISDRVT